MYFEILFCVMLLTIDNSPKKSEFFFSLWYEILPLQTNLAIFFFSCQEKSNLSFTVICYHNFSSESSGKKLVILISFMSYPNPCQIQCPNCTMLQNLSKCEVKAWLCWNLIILPPLRFYVKSHFGEFKQSENVNFVSFRGSEFWFE